MEERMHHTEVLLDLLRNHFPLTCLEECSQLVIELLDVPPEPQLAIIGLILNLLNYDATEPGKKRREKPAETSITLPVTWEQFWHDWEMVQKVMTMLRRNILPHRQKKIVSSSPGQLQIIYRFLMERIKIDTTARDLPVYQLTKFLQTFESPWTCHEPLQMSLSDFKMLSLILAQLAGLDVHLSRSESWSFLRNRDGSFVPVPGHESDSQPQSSLPVPGARLLSDDAWMYSQKQFVHCDRYMEVAYLCCSLDGDDFRKVDNQFSTLQHSVLGHLHGKHRLKLYPSAVSVYGYLKFLHAHGDAEEISTAEDVLLESIEINREKFRNAYVGPYVLFFDYLSALGNPLPAVLPAYLTSEVIQQYSYSPNTSDKRLHDELNIMATAMDQFISKDFRSRDATYSPTLAALIIGFIDNICLWEEKSKVTIWHSIWSSKLVRSCLGKTGTGSLQQVMLHGSIDSMQKVVPPVRNYVSETLHFLRNPAAAATSATVTPETVDEILSEENLTEEFCKLALSLYEKWPPMHLDYGCFENFLHEERAMLAGMSPDKCIYPEDSDRLVQMLKLWPTTPSVSDEELKTVSRIRPVNPLYCIFSKHVFPFLDMGPRNVPIFCFDTEKIRKHIRCPLPGSVESRVIYRLQQRLVHLTGSSNLDVPGFAHVLLKSQKMLNVRSLLGQEKFNAAGICLRLEGSSAVNPVDGCRERRERKPSAKACLK